MKRSRKLKLGLLGAAPILLSACGGDEPRSYTNLQDCLKDPRQNTGLCQAAYDRARAAHLQGAERFPNQALCESQSQMPCDPLGAGADSSVYIPRLAGFQVEPQYRRESSGSWWQYAAAYAAGSILGGRGGGWQQRPIYRDYGNQGWSSGDNRSSRPDNSWSSGGGDGGKISTATLSRGGFGGAAAARSSWGG